MHTFSLMLEEMGLTECETVSKYSTAGKLFYTQNEEYEGYYWYCETDLWIIDIHDFFIKKEKIIGKNSNFISSVLFTSTYILSANGESLNPYQEITANTIIISCINNNLNRFLLHANSNYLTVGINFKEKFFADFIQCETLHPDINIAAMFMDTRTIVTKPMSEIAQAILHCTMKPPVAQLFLDAKAKEWFSITLDAYLNITKRKKIYKTDEQAIENVASYINDHYALDISQELLEKIAMMSGTKLKSIFKQKYQMSITEYTQRKRMNIAESLLLTTNLDIKDIARAVGYSSHSKFTNYFKKIKGVYPSDIRKNIQRKAGFI